MITSATQDINANENLDNTYVRQKRYSHEVHICLITCRRHQNSFVFSCPNPCPEHTRNKQTLIKNFWSLDKVGTRLEKMNAFHSNFQPKYSLLSLKGGGHYLFFNTLIDFLTYIGLTISNLNNQLMC